MDPSEYFHSFLLVVCSWIGFPIVSLLLLIYELPTVISSLVLHRNNEKVWKNVIVTGASSGIGRHLAVELSKRNTSHIILMGRNSERLKETSTVCQTVGSSRITTITVDVNDDEAMRREISSLDDKYHVDLVLASAGVSLWTSGLEEVSFEQGCRSVIHTNLNGVLNTLFPALEGMKKRKEGHVCLVSSLAGVLPLSGKAAAYSASKHALVALGLGLRTLYSKDNIEISVSCPGFVSTPMVKSKSFLPMLMTADEAAKRIMKGVDCNIAVHAFPRRMLWFLWILRMLPFTLQDIVLSWTTT